MTNYRGSDKLAFINLLNYNIGEIENSPEQTFDNLKFECPELDDVVIKNLIIKAMSGWVGIEEVFFPNEVPEVIPFQRKVLADKIELHDCIDTVYEFGMNLEDLLFELEETYEDLNTFDLVFINEVLDDLEVQADNDYLDEVFGN